MSKAHPAFEMFDPPLPALPRLKHSRKPKKLPRHSASAPSHDSSSSGGWRSGEGGLQTPDCMSAGLSFDDFFYHPGPELEQRLLGPEAPSTSTVKMEPPADLPDSAFDFFPSASCALADSPAVPGHSPDHPLKNGNDVDASLEIYRDLILRHLVTDIASTCAKLRISPSPEEWSGRDAVVWAEEMATQFQLGEVNTGSLAMPGCRLAALSLDDFLAACPRTGDTLHAQLQIWKTAADFRRLNSAQPTPVSMVAPPPPPVSGPHRHDASDWLASWDPNADDPTPPALHHPQHPLPPLAASHYGLCVQTGMNQYLLPKGGAQGMGGAHYAHLLSPSDSDSGISADLDEDMVGPGVRKMGMPGQSTGSIHLWQFIRELLDHPDKYAQCLRWIDRAEGIFKIEDSHKLARLWGQRKNRHKMNYDKLSRSLRQYYKKGIIRKTGQRQRLIYQFIPPYHLL